LQPLSLPLVVSPITATLSLSFFPIQLCRALQIRISCGVPCLSSLVFALTTMSIISRSHSALYQSRYFHFLLQHLLHRGMFILFFFLPYPSSHQLKYSHTLSFLPFLLRFFLYFHPRDVRPHAERRRAVTERAVFGAFRGQIFTCTGIRVNSNAFLTLAPFMSVYFLLRISYHSNFNLLHCTVLSYVDFFSIAHFILCCSSCNTT